MASRPRRACHGATTTCSRGGSRKLPNGLTTQVCESGLAIFDDDRKYRYRLTRRWDDSRPSVCWIMLNPSTASACTDDATLRRVVGFSRSWGYGSLDVVNLFALKTPDPRVLKGAADPVGPRNDEILAAAAQRSAVVIAAWGNGGSLENPATGISRCDEVNEIFARLGAELLSLQETRHHQPRHPLYAPGTLTPVPFRA